MVKFRMLEEIGVVKAIEGPIAVVNIPRKSACEGCTAGTCRPEQQSMEIEAVNKAGAKPGQKVRISIQTFAYMKGSMLVYGLPALALVIGAVIGKEFMKDMFPGTDPDLLSAIFGFGAFILSFIGIKIWSMGMAKKTGSRPVVEEILDERPVP